MIKIIFSFILCSAALARIDGPWGPLSDPIIMRRAIEYEFVKLPLEGTGNITEHFWSGDYWANNKGSINYRWNGDRREGFDYVSPTRAELLKMSSMEIAKLSPTEKYDLFTGKYHYPLKNEVAKIANRNSLSWEGICHGWAPASINHAEPKPKIMTNPSGVKIPFGSSDIKALLSYYYAFGFEVPNTYQMGRRCESGGISRAPDCQDDLNAGAFHLVLTNKMGRLKESFIGDMNRYKEIWNHPIISYKSRILKDNIYPRRGCAQQTNREIKIETQITYVEGGVNTWEPLLHTTAQKYKIKKLSYYLEVDYWGNIIGGEWISKERIDFIWLKSPSTKFRGTLSRLGELLTPR